MSARSAQLLAAVLGFLLIVLIGAVIFFLLSRPAQGPSVTPTPTAALSPGVSPSISPIPSGSPLASASLLPTLSLEPFPSPSPVVTPDITPTISPSPSPTPSPTATPTPTLPPATTSPGRQIRVDNLGLDGKNPEVGVERYLVFHVDGPSLIRITLSNSTGRACLKLWEGEDVPETCTARLRNGTIERRTDEAGQTTWTLSLIGVEQALGPVADVTVDFNANSPQVIVENLRFQGQPVPNYNGIAVAVDALFAGQLQISGKFDGSQQHMYRVVIDQVGGGNLQDTTAGPANTFVVTQAVTASTSYNVSVSNPNVAQEPSPVFLEATFSWP